MCYIFVSTKTNKPLKLNIMKKLGNRDIIEIANVKLMNGYSESRVCDWVFEMCNNDNRACNLLKYILDSDEVLLGY